AAKLLADEKNEKSLMSALGGFGVCKGVPGVVTQLELVGKKWSGTGKQRLEKLLRAFKVSGKTQEKTP
ncbi:hypothetical protein KJ865_09770, partial [Myxococcota bacterium]|nr:hypothetical protein [Myxococcota bacterium]